MTSTGTEGTSSAQDDRRRLRNALGQFATGVAVVTTATPSGKLEGVTVNSFSALSLDPPLILWSLRREAASFSSFAGCTHFAVSILNADQWPLSHHFSRPTADKFDGVANRAGRGGCPVIDASIAVFECAVHDRIEAGDHLLFIGAVEDYHLSDGTPLIFSAGRYCAPAAIDMSDRTSFAKAC